LSQSENRVKKHRQKKREKRGGEKREGGANGEGEDIITRKDLLKRKNIKVVDRIIFPRRLTKTKYSKEKVGKAMGKAR